MKEFRVSRSVAHAVDLADGRSVGPGDETGRIDENDPHNKALIDDGVLIASERKKSSAGQTGTSQEGDDS